MRPIITAWRCLSVWTTAFVVSSAFGADPALGKRCDELIQTKAKDASFAPVCDDSTFVRRLYLDLAGRIPSSQEATAFVDNKEPNKREQLVDKLMACPDYAARMRDHFHATLMERRGDSADWTKFLQASFESNKPWDQLVREILAPDQDHEINRGAAFFHTKRLEKVGQQDTDYPGLTRDVGRLFLGMDLQCAQCHNHLFIESYKQSDFQGLFTVYQNTFIRNDLKFPAIGEKLMTKKQEFSSVFDKVSMSVGPRVPGGKEIDIPMFDKNEEYAAPPDRKTNFPGVPKFRPMQVIATELANTTNKAFAVNFANRVWFALHGRGLVNPLDQIHAANPASHPEVLELLAQASVDLKFDVKALVRALVLSDTYQRETQWSSTDLPKPETYRAALEKRLSAEQVMASVLVATGTREKPTILKGDAEKNRAAFVKAFGNVPTDPEVEFAPSLKSSLFLLNDALIVECLQSQPGNLIERLSATADNNTAIDDLYWSILTRKPVEEERSMATAYLTKNADRRPAAMTNLAWSLLASTEFCLNH